MSEEINTHPSEVELLETLKEGKNSVVFKVRFREKLCVMKVVSKWKYLTYTLCLLFLAEL